MPFQLLTPTPATLTSVTPRIEKHGTDSVPAVSIGLKITAANTILDNLSPGLLATLYTAPEVPDAQQHLEGTEATHLPLLRSRVIEKLALKGELEGWCCTVAYGIDSDSDIDLSGCKIDKFRVEPKEGGTVDLFLRCGTSNVDEHGMGRLSMLIGLEVDVTITAPEKAPDLIDASKDGDWPFPEPEAAPEKEAGELFAAAHSE